LVDEIQARLDSYKTRKQRKQRIRELNRMFDDGFATMDVAIEFGALKAGCTAQAMSDGMRRIVMEGKHSLYVNIDGERYPLPQEVIRRSTPN